jgi:hypothetical protein
LLLKVRLDRLLRRLSECAVHQFLRSCHLLPEVTLRIRDSLGGKQVVGNVGLYFAAYRLSQMGWNVMPTARNTRGIDLLAYDATVDNKMGIQVKTLSKYSAVSLGTKGLDSLLGDWWIIVVKVATDPKCFVIKPDEVKKRAVRDKEGARAYWLPAKPYNTDEFREAWDRIGRGDVTVDHAALSAGCLV